MTWEEIDILTLHRGVQSALLGAIHGLEQHCARLIAEWNHQALFDHAQHLTDSFAAGLLTATSSGAPPGHEKLQQRQSSHATLGGSPPETLETPDSEQADAAGGSGKQESADVQCQGTRTGEASRPQLPGLAAPAALASSNALQTSPKASDQPATAIGTDCEAGSLSAYGAAGSPRGCDHQPARPPAEQLASRLAEGAKSGSERLQAVLEGPVSPAMAVAVLAAVHAGAASLGLTAGLHRMPWPLYLIDTRDSFTHHLHVEHCHVVSSPAAACAAPWSTHLKQKELPCRYCVA